MSCPVCRKPVSMGDSIKQKCGHRTHGYCMDQSAPNFKECASCRGEIDLSQPLLPASEPASLSGRDYIANPVKPGRLDTLRKKASRYLSRESIEDSVDPHFLLAQGPTQCPIDYLIREKGLGLQRMLEEGVQIADFLNGNYTWKDLSLFHDLNPQKVSAQRVKDALFALGVNAEHFRDNHLPLQELQEQIDLTPHDIISLFGLHFPESGDALGVEGGENKYAWQADDLVAMKFTEKDLKGAGLQYVEQLEDLDPTDAHLAKMSISDRFLDQLPFLTPPEPQVKIAPVERKARVKKPQARPSSPPLRIKRLHGLRKK